MAGFGLGTLSAARHWHARAAQDATPEAGCRIVTHALGESCVPFDPERVVALWSAVDVALAVGIVPVGIDDLTAATVYLDEATDGIPTVGLPWEPNLEAIAALDPDLIVGLDVLVESIYPELMAIAPTVGVAFGGTSGNWKAYNRGYAEAMGREDAFDEVMTAYEAKAERFRAAMGDRLGETEVAILSASPADLRFDLPGIFVGSVVYTDAGLRLPPRLVEYHAANPNVPILGISAEEFTLAEGADALFLWVASGDPEEDEAVIAAALEHPVLRRLEAVDQGRAFAMGDHWFSESVLGASLILDDLERALLGEDG
jgi:iron complex transport system substrate-binding protein